MGLVDHRRVEHEDRPHGVHAAVVRAGRIRVDGDPLLVGIARVRVLRGHQVVRVAAVRGYPARCRRLARQGRVWMHGDRDRLGRNSRVDLIRPVVVVVPAGLTVIELVGQDHGVEVAPRVERPDRVRVVGPSLVAGDVALHRPGRAAVERLIEAEQVVVALAIDHPFALADQVAGIVGVDPKVRLGVVLHPQRRVGDVLGRVRTQVLAGRRRAGACRAAAVEVAVGRGQTVDVQRLGRVAADALGGRRDVRDALGCSAGSERRVGLDPLWWCRCERRRRHERGGQTTCDDDATPHPGSPS